MHGLVEKVGHEFELRKQDSQSNQNSKQFQKSYFEDFFMGADEHRFQLDILEDNEIVNALNG